MSRRNQEKLDFPIILIVAVIIVYFVQPELFWRLTHNLLVIAEPVIDSGKNYILKFLNTIPN